MNSHTLASSTVAACLLLGVSGAAMAVGCPEGRIIGEVVDEIVVDGQACLVFDTTVSGKVQVTNSPGFEITSSDVGGPITIQGTGPETSDNASVLRNNVLKGNIEVTNFGSALVVVNTLDNGNIKVTNNVGAVVQRNTVR